MGAVGVYYIPNPPSANYLPPGLSTLLPTSKFQLTHHLFRSSFPLPGAPPSSSSSPAPTPSSSSPPPPPPQTPQPQQQQQAQLLQLIDIPHASRLTVCVLNSGAHTITATHDLHFMLRTKLAATWQHRQTLKITGEVWELMGGEWRVRVGRIMKEGGGQGLPVKGVVVEVEWVGGETMVESVLKGVGEEVVGLKDGRWVCGADGEPGGVEQVGRVWAEVLRFR